MGHAGQVLGLVTASGEFTPYVPTAEDGSQTAVAILYGPLGESDICCGAAGTYNLTETEMAERLVARKTEHVRQTAATAVLMANAGCLLHIGRRLRQEGQHVWLAHPVEVLDLSYRGAPPPTV